MNVLTELQRSRPIYAECPACSKEFSLTEADLFDATKPLSARGLGHLQLLQAELAEAHTEFEAVKKRAEERSRLGAERVGIGKILEKIAPSLPGFPLIPSDCRSLWEPIDYLAFPGLTASGVVEAIVFVDVKSGHARLTGVQRTVQSIIELGRLSLVVTEPPKEVKP